METEEQHHLTTAPDDNLHMEFPLRRGRERLSWRQAYIDAEKVWGPGWPLGTGKRGTAARNLKAAVGQEAARCRYIEQRLLARIPWAFVAPFSVEARHAWGKGFSVWIHTPFRPGEDTGDAHYCTYDGDGWNPATTSAEYVPKVRTEEDTLIPRPARLNCFYQDGFEASLEDCAAHFERFRARRYLSTPGQPVLPLQLVPQEQRVAWEAAMAQLPATLPVACVDPKRVAKALAALRRAAVDLAAGCVPPGGPAADRGAE